ncbi:MAG: hypothetical protein JXB88_07155 [Spirochaetales bacterium]|nr:hypothetical protein [Spirochaetales bacterium]
MENKVIVTGMGVLSPLGIELEKHITALKEGLCGIRFESRPGTDFPKVSGTVPGFKALDYITDKKALKIMNRQNILGCSAAVLAIKDAGLTRDIINQSEDDAMLFAGGVMDSILPLCEAVIPCLRSNGTIDYTKLGDYGYRNLPPLWILARLPNTTSGQISIQHTIKGFNNTIVNGMVSAALAIGEGYLQIKHGRSERVFCGGAEGEIYPDFYIRNENYGWLSGNYTGSAAFSVTGNGCLLSEGGAVLVLENEQATIRPNAQCYGEIIGYSNRYIPSFKEESWSRITPHYEKCMRDALDDAKIKAENVDFVQANGWGYQKMDYAEAAAIKAVYGSKAYITGCQPATGNTLAGMPAIAVCYALLQLNYNFIAPLIRTGDLFFEKELNYVKEKAISNHNRVCLVNSFDHLGGACSIVMKEGGTDK